jgi:hypothetical protein
MALRGAFMKIPDFSKVDFTFLPDGDGVASVILFTVNISVQLA